MSHTSHVFVDAAVARETAYQRQGGYCMRCPDPLDPRTFEAHHRRRRAILDWCLCNIVALHPRCHTMGALAVHDHPQIARDLGLIVSSYGELEPCQIQVSVTWPWRGPALLSCDGMVCSPDSADVCC